MAERSFVYGKNKKACHLAGFYLAVFGHSPVLVMISGPY